MLKEIPWGGQKGASEDHVGQTEADDVPGGETSRSFRGNGSRGGGTYEYRSRHRRLSHQFKKVLWKCKKVLELFEKRRLNNMAGKKRDGESFFKKGAMKGIEVDFLPA